jgi:hypothetical protein
MPASLNTGHVVGVADTDAEAQAPNRAEVVDTLGELLDNLAGPDVGAGVEIG